MNLQEVYRKLPETFIYYNKIQYTKKYSSKARHSRCRCRRSGSDFPRVVIWESDKGKTITLAGHWSTRRDEYGTKLCYPLNIKGG